MSGHSGFSQATWHSCWNRTRWASCCNYLFSPVSSQICSDENIACKMSQGQTNPLPKACRQVFPGALCKFFFFMQTLAADDWMSECDSLASQLQLYIVTKESAHNLSHGFQKQGDATFLHDTGFLVLLYPISLGFSLHPKESSKDRS